MSFLIVNYAHNSKYFVEKSVLEKACKLTLSGQDKFKVKKLKTHLIDNNFNLIINLEIAVLFGVQISKVISEIQTNIKNSIFQLIGTSPQNIQITIQERFNNG